MVIENLELRWILLHFYHACKIFIIDFVLCVKQYEHGHHEKDHLRESIKDSKTTEAIKLKVAQRGKAMKWLLQIYPPT